MSHQVVYRKYRSQDFSELIGQEHIAKTLSNQILNDSVGHAYLFFGPRGCGKTSTARIFAKTVNCLTPLNENGILTPCGKCESCKDFNTDDMDIIEMDAASNRGIDDARLLRDKANAQPIGHKYKVIILDEAHMLTREAVNALLKIIEEPPIYMIFIFCTTEFHKIPVTIASRCQRFKFLLAKKEDLVKKLKLICEKEGKNLSDEELNIIATMAKGSFRDSESLLEQVIHSSDENSFKDLFHLYSSGSSASEFVNALVNDDLEKIWNILIENEEAQNDVKQLLDIALEHSKNLLEVGDIKFEKYIEIVKIVGSFRTGGKEEFIYRYLNTKAPAANSINVNDTRIPVQQINEINANTAKNSNTVKENFAKRPASAPTWDSSIKNTVENKATENAEKHTEIKELNIKNINELFRDRPVIFNMLSKSEIIIKDKIIYINVTSTVSKLLLTKNKVNTILISHYQDMVNDVKIEVVKNNSTVPSETKVAENPSSEKKDEGSNSPEDIEKLFGTKFQ